MTDVVVDTATPDQTPDPVAGKTVAEILGEIVWLMTQDPVGREMKVAEIEKLVMPAILEKCFHIKYAQAPNIWRQGTTLQPVEVNIYAPPHPSDNPASQHKTLAKFALKAGAMHK